MNRRKEKSKTGRHKITQLEDADDIDKAVLIAKMHING